MLYMCAVAGFSARQPTAELSTVSIEVCWGWVGVFAVSKVSEHWPRGVDRSLGRWNLSTEATAAST